MAQQSAADFLGIKPAADSSAPATPASKPATDTPKSAQEFLGLSKSAPAAPSSAGPAKIPAFNALPQTAAATKEISDEVAKLRGMDPSIDYETGAAPMAKWWLSRSDNSKEAQAALQNFYGPGNIGQDSAGRWWVKQGGKKVSVFGRGQGFGTAMEKLGYDTLAYSPVLGGAIAGAGVGGAEGGPAAPATAMLGAGVGAAGGKALDEFVKNLQGVYAKTPKEELSKLGQDAVFNATFEGLSPAAKAILGPIKNGIKSFLGLTEANVSMTKNLTREGARVPVTTGLPGASTLQWHADLRNRVMGDPKEAHNVAYVRGQLVDLLKQSGHTPEEINGMMQEVTGKESALSPTETGKRLSEGASEYKQSLQKEADSAVSTAKSAVSDEMKTLTKISETDPTGLGKDSARVISLARQKFGRSMTRAYTAADEMTGGEHLVKYNGIADAAGNALRSLPETEQPPALKLLSKRDANYTFMGAHALRSELRSMADHANLTRDPKAHFYNEVADAVDNAITGAGKDMEERGEQNAAKVLKGIDSQYREGIGKFKDVTFRQMVRRAQTGIFPEPDAVVRQLVKPGEVERLNTFMQMAPPSVRQKIASADMRNMLAASKGNDSLFLNEVITRGPALDAVYGAGEAGKIRTAAKELAALGGKLPENMTLEPGQVADALAKQATYTKMLDKFVAENPVAALANPKTADRAVRLVTMPGKENATLDAMNFYGPNSPEWKSVQTDALKGILSAAIEKTPSLDSKIIAMQ